MPFVKGQSGNPSGARTKRQWIQEKQRIAEARKTFAKLIETRDGLVLERKQIGIDDGGQPLMADVVASVKDLLKCCEIILDRCIGKPKQEVEVSGADGGPVQTVTTIERRIVHVNAEP